MSTPMNWIGEHEFMCAVCFGRTPLDSATFDVVDMERVNVCIPCRMGETYWMIRKHAAYEGQEDG